MKIFGSFNPNLTRQYDSVKKTNPEVYKLFEELDLFNVIVRIEMSDKAVKVFMGMVDFTNNEFKVLAKSRFKLQVYPSSSGDLILRIILK